MTMRSVRLATLVILGLALALVPMLVGCGGGGSESEKVVVTIGTLADFTGPASFAVVPTVYGFEEAIDYYQEQNPIEGVRIKFERYDMQLNYSKSVQGYQTLKAQGMDILYAMNGQDRDLLKNYVEEDRIPTVGSSGLDEDLSLGWIYSPVPSLGWQGESAMLYVFDAWDYQSNGVPKIGHQGFALTQSTRQQWGIDQMINDPTYSGKFEWVGYDDAAMTNVTWTTSYQKFKDCDVIYVSLVGNQLATFISQMRALGYKGWFIAGTDSLTGYWALVQNNTPAAQLYDCYYVWWGPIYNSTDSDADWFQALVATTQKYHNDWASRLATTGPESGWFLGRTVYDAISRAVESVGADNLDGDALKAAFDATSLDMAGTGNTYSFSADRNVGLYTLRPWHWNLDTLKWEVAKDKWYIPTTLPS